MKRSLKIVLLVVSSAVSTGCLAQIATSASDSQPLSSLSYTECILASTVSIELYQEYRFLMTSGYRKSQHQDPSGAVADFSKALLIKPHDLQALSSRGYANYQAQQFKAALVDYDQCLRLAPDDADLYIKRGLLKARLHEFESARLDFDKALLLAPKRYLPLLKDRCLRNLAAGAEGYLDSLEKALSVSQ